VKPYELSLDFFDVIFYMRLKNKTVTGNKNPKMGGMRGCPPPKKLKSILERKSMTSKESSK